MGNIKLYVLLALFTTFWGCNESAKQQDIVINGNQTRWLKNCDNCNQYITNINHVKLHESSEKSSDLLGYLKEGEIVKILDINTYLEESFSLRGVSYFEPWVEIETSKGKTGWIFRGALDIMPEQISAEGERIIESRLMNTFGEEIKEDVKETSINLQFNNVVDVLTFYKESKTLLPRLNKVIRNDFISRENVLPKLAWLDVCFPFCSIYQANNNFYYFLDFDYDKMLKIAYSTPDADDDTFVELLSSLAKTEKEYVVSQWENLDANDRVCNNIGQGDYLKVLSHINDEYTNNQIFKEEILDVKNKVIKTLVRNNKKFCFDKKLVYAELQSILKSDISILSNDDLGELRELSKRFK